ncbi:hypothetical protein BKA82DRAFT_4013102 [Pisolithus tinctorius]|nr:hypothetical protein BKA82DRAFT_4013102 [Pisolithus tinctorius]
MCSTCDRSQRSLHHPTIIIDNLNRARGDYLAKVITAGGWAPGNFMDCIRCGREIYRYKCHLRPVTDRDTHPNTGVGPTKQIKMGSFTPFAVVDPRSTTLNYESGAEADGEGHEYRDDQPGRNFFSQCRRKKGRKSQPENFGGVEEDIACSMDTAYSTEQERGDHAQSARQHPSSVRGKKKPWINQRCGQEGTIAMTTVDKTSVIRQQGGLGTLERENQHAPRKTGNQAQGPRSAPSRDTSKEMMNHRDGNLRSNCQAGLMQRVAVHEPTSAFLAKYLVQERKFESPTDKDRQPNLMHNQPRGCVAGSKTQLPSLEVWVGSPGV